MAHGQTLHDYIQHGSADLYLDKGEVAFVNGPNIVVDWELTRGRETFFESSEELAHRMSWDDSRQAWVV